MTEKTKNSQSNRNKIIDEYISHILETGSEPVSVFKFTKDMKMKEAVFYEYFSSFGAVKKSVWELIFDNTIQALESQEIYQSYTSREKLLGFLFTWIEELKNRRSYLLAVYGNVSLKNQSYPSELKGFKAKFKEFASGIVNEGKETEEIAERPYLTDKYQEAMWLQVMFVFRFWIKDDSPAFEKTDAAIEKSVNLAFDLMGRSAIDSFVDFAKFLFQSK